MASDHCQTCEGRGMVVDVDGEAIPCDDPDHSGEHQPWCNKNQGPNAYAVECDCDARLTREDDQ